MNSISYVLAFRGQRKSEDSAHVRQARIYADCSNLRSVGTCSCITSSGVMDEQVELIVERALRTNALVYDMCTLHCTAG
jgi:hypothetical protein